VFRLRDVPPNLFPQLFDRSKPDLIAQPRKENDLNLRLWSQFQRMEIQQMGFNGK
jgi:hypothetical protein